MCLFCLASILGAQYIFVEHMSEQVRLAVHLVLTVGTQLKSTGLYLKKLTV